MKYKDIIKDANANLLKSKVRTFLTISAVFVGAFTLSMTNGLGDGIRKYINDQLGNAGASNILYIIPKGENQKAKDENGGLSEYNPDRAKNTTLSNSPSGSTYLVKADLDKIKSTEGIQEVYPTYMMTPEYMTTGGKKFSVALDQYIEGTNLQLSAGKLVNNASPNDITIPEAYLKPLGLGIDPNASIGKSVTFAFNDENGQQFEKTGTIVGVQSKSLLGGSSINASAVFAKSVQDQQTGEYVQANPRYAFLLAKFDDSKGKDYTKDLQSRLGNEGYDAVTFQDQLGTVSKVLDTAIMGLNFFGAIALIAASFGIINTLYIAVQERTREIGLMKALGMKKSRIFALFSFEAILIGLWGSVLGILAANGAGALVNSVASNTFLKDFEGFNLLAFPLRSELAVVIIILFISFLAGSLPARKASKKDPIEALRYE